MARSGLIELRQWVGEEQAGLTRQCEHPPNPRRWMPRHANRCERRDSRKAIDIWF